jgi:hypothetical protein
MDEYDDDHGPNGPWHKLRNGPSVVPNFVPKNYRQRTVPLYLFVVFVVSFGLVTLALALGLSLGLGRPRYRSIWTTAPPIDYDGYYGIPKDLEVIPCEKLINAKELDLDTGFVVRSDQPQTREYVFDISQALAAPDGFQKPMILVNGQSPGPLIEANSGDTSE